MDGISDSVSHHILLYSSYFNKTAWFLSDEGQMLETLDNTIRIGSIPTILYFDLYLYSPYAAHYVYQYLITRYCSRALMGSALAMYGISVSHRLDSI